MDRLKVIPLQCPHCDIWSSFEEIDGSQRNSKYEDLFSNAYVCTHCNGLIVATWYKGTARMRAYYPSLRNWKPRVKLPSITNDGAREDFSEAIGCYSNGYYNACMAMARRAIHQEMKVNKIEGQDLYRQIESTEIPQHIKALLKKVKDLGNYGAHPNFLLFDGDGKQIDDKEQFAKLSLELLDRYFWDQYETKALMNKMPNSKHELDTKRS